MKNSTLILAVLAVAILVASDVITRPAPGQGPQLAADEDILRQMNEIRAQGGAQSDSSAARTGPPTTPFKEGELPKDMMDDVTVSVETVVDKQILVHKGTLTIKPGVKLIFKPGAAITLSRDGALIAQGTAEAPIELVGEKSGEINGLEGKVVLSHCRISGMGEVTAGGDMWLRGRASKGVVVENCAITDCSAIWVGLGSFRMTNCELRKCRGSIGFYGRGSAVLEDNTIEDAGIGSRECSSVTLRNNVIVGASISDWGTNKVLFEGNYIHRGEANDKSVILYAKGQIKNNVFRGGTWVARGIGGEITGNAFIALPTGDAATQAFFRDLASGAKLSGNVAVGLTATGAPTDLPEGVRFVRGIQGELFPFKDEDLLSRKVTPAQVLKAYLSAPIEGAYGSNN